MAFDPTVRDVMADAVILVVDDIDANVMLLKALLGRAGARSVVGVSDPLRAVAEYEAIQPDLILLDLHMPNIDGIEVLERLSRVIPSDSFTPIIMLTADTTREAKERALACGAHDFVNKPFEQTELLLRVRNLLTTRALHLSLEQHNAALEQEIFEHEARAAAAASEREQRVVRMRRVLDGDALDIVFQPIVELTSNRVVGVEALSRFRQDPHRSPDVWFAEAASIGLGSELELLAVRRSLEYLDRLPADAYLSLNASPVTAVHPDLYTALSVAPERVVVEVTEHAQVDDYDALAIGLDRLRAIGVRIAVDDAGSGYASLRHILRLQPDMIKLDIDLTRNIDTDPARRALAAAFVLFAREIGATITAEGIETEAESETLQSLHVTNGQGYFFARPAPLDAAAAAATPAI